MSEFSNIFPGLAGMVLGAAGFWFAKHMARRRARELAAESLNTTPTT